MTVTIALDRKCREKSEMINNELGFQMITTMLPDGSETGTTTQTLPPLWNTSTWKKPRTRMGGCLGAL